MASRKMPYDYYFIISYYTPFQLLSNSFADTIFLRTFHMKKILQVVPSISKASGVMSFVMNLYRNLDQSEYQFDFIYIEETPTSFKDEIQKLGGNTTFISKPNIYNALNFYEKVNEYLKKHSGEYSAIHLHEVLVGIVMLPLAKKYGIDIRIIHSHNSMPSEKPSRAFRNNLLCLPIKKLSNVWLACSDKAGKFLYGEKAKKKVKVVNNGIEIDKYTYDSKIRQSVRAELNICQDTLVIGHVGRFCDQKNQIHLINTVEILKNNNINVILLLVGIGPSEEYLKTFVKEKSLESYVKFLGLRTDIPELLQGMDVFALPSLFEGLPIAGIEAQAAGLPCVFSDTITREADVTGNVIYLPLTSPHEVWAEKIIEVFKTKPRRDTREEMKKAGFDIGDLVKSMRIVYGDKISQIFHN